MRAAALALFLAACGAAPHAPTVPPAPPAALSAELDELTPDDARATAVIAFTNAGDHPLTIRSFRVTWEGGALTAPTLLHVPAHATTTAALSIGPEAGDLYALYRFPLATRVIILSAD